MKKSLILFYLCVSLIIQKNSYSQDDGFRPQVWSNAGIGFKTDNGFYFLNTLSYNILLSNELPWNEFSNSLSAAYTFNPYIAVIGEFYASRTKQSATLSSTELRPAAALRLSTHDERRWRVANVSKFEFRFLDYTDNEKDNTVRFRNRTLISATVKEQNLKQVGSIAIYSYLEFFHNFEENVEERFFKSAKAKLGGTYKMSDHWRFDLGFIFLDATNTIVEPSTLPTNIITNYILEIGVYYII